MKPIVLSIVIFMFFASLTIFLLWPVKREYIHYLNTTRGMMKLSATVTCSHLRHWFTNPIKFSSDTGKTVYYLKSENQAVIMLDDVSVTELSRGITTSDHIITNGEMEKW